MIDVDKKRNVETYGQISEGMFGISDGDQAHILTILRDKLYSNKPLAVIREYSTNGVDAHIEAGIPDEPIRVRLPNLANPHFLVRDFGRGLSEDKVYNLYTKYGASTKRGTNKAIGQLGLGCKSGFAYSDNFTITSYHEGIKSIYHAFIDETNVGKVVKMHEEPSDERSGIEISIPVKMNDFETFKKTAKICYAHFDVIPDCELNLPPKKYVFGGDSWGVRDLNTVEIKNADYFVREALRGAVAIMGNIAYPIKAKEIPGLKEEEAELLNLPLEIKFKIGALSISASREALEYTERTQRNIKFGLKKVTNEFKKEMSKRFDNCKDVWEARSVYQEIERETLNQPHSEFLNKVLRAFSKWNGHNIAIRYFSYESGAENIHGSKISIDAITPYRGNWGKTATYQKDTILVINDTKSAWVKKCLAIRDYIKEKDGKYVEIIAVSEKPVDNDALIKMGAKPPKTFDDGIEKYIKHHGLQGIRTFRLSDLDQEIIDLMNSGNVVSPVNRTSAKKLRSKTYRLNNPYLKCERIKPSGDWDKEEVDLENGEGVYLVINAFRPTQISGSYNSYGIRKSSSAELRDMLAALKETGYDFDKTPIYGFRHSVIPKLGEGWIEFKKFFEQEIKDLAKKKNVTQDIADMLEYDRSIKLSKAFCKSMVENEKLFKDPNEPMLVCCKKFLEFHKKFSMEEGNIRGSLELWSKWAERFKIDLDNKPSFEISNVVKTLREAYPLIYKANGFNKYIQVLRDPEIYIDYCNKCRR